MRSSRVVVFAVVLAGSLAALPDSGRASFPGANGRIVLSGHERGSSGPVHLFSVAADGSDLRQITTGPDDDGAVSAAPGGGSLAFSRDTHEQCGHLYWAQGVDVFTARSDGSGVKRVTDNCPISDSTPAWSPSGQHIVLSRFGYLWSMTPDGGDLAKLTCPPSRGYGDGGDYAPNWSPDGSSIAFARFDEVYLMDANGDSQRRVATGESPSFSPDGTTIAYAGHAFTAAAGIHVVAPDGSGDVRLTSGRDASPVWSPDGTKIAFVRGSGQTPQTYSIWTMNADGSGGTKIMDALDAGSLTWAQAAPVAGAAEPGITAARTACAETPPEAPASVPTAPAGPPESVSQPAYVAAASIEAPDRLRVARALFKPVILRARKPFSLTVEVRDLAGRLVSGAAVRITPLRGDAKPTGQVQTGQNGVATLRVSPTRRLHLRRGGRLTLAVHVRRPGDPWTGELSALRLVSVRTAPAPH